MKVAVIGGGAAGFYAAICCKEFHPHASVTIYEKTTKLLSKVKISGGGRCNVTHDAKYPSDLAKNYPRGGKQLKKHFKSFNNHHIIKWFESRGVALKVEPDGRMFPTTDRSQTIIDTFMTEVNKLGIEIKMKSALTRIEHSEGQLELSINDQKILFDAVIIATGGSNSEVAIAGLRMWGTRSLSRFHRCLPLICPRSRL